MCFPVASSYEVGYSVLTRAGMINRLIDNESILKHQTDYRKQNLISFNGGGIMNMLIRQ